MTNEPYFDELPPANPSSIIDGRKVYWDSGAGAFGNLLMVCGVALAIYSLFLFDSSVSSYMGSEINNIGLLNQQMMLMIAASGLFVCGGFFSAANLIIKAIVTSNLAQIQE